MSGRPGQPGTVRGFNICQGSVRELTKSRGSVVEKSCQESCLLLTSCCSCRLQVFSGLMWPCIAI